MYHSKGKHLTCKRHHIFPLSFASFCSILLLFNSGIVSWLGVFPLNEAPSYLGKSCFSGISYSHVWCVKFLRNHHHQASFSSYKRNRGIITHKGYLLFHVTSLDISSCDGSNSLLLVAAEHCVKYSKYSQWNPGRLIGSFNIKITTENNFIPKRFQVVWQDPYSSRTSYFITNSRNALKELLVL